ncbi:hypothetical protein D3C78_1967330 [compost metagenome]
MLYPLNLFAARATLQLIAQIRWRTSDRQGISGRIPENTLPQQHRIKVQADTAAAAGKFGQLA